jgi:SET domain-containing protein
LCKIEGYIEKEAGVCFYKREKLMITFTQFITEGKYTRQFEPSDKAPVNRVEYISDPAESLKSIGRVRSFSKVGYGKSKVASRGVFATDDIAKGEVIEEAPFIKMDVNSVKGTPLMDYVMKIDDDTFAFPLGYGGLYNHRNQPMADWRIDPVEENIRFIAIRDIAKGEEIYISYGQNYWSSRNIDMNKDI